MKQIGYYAQPGGGWVIVEGEAEASDFGRRVEACAAENPGVVVVGARAEPAGLEAIQPMPEIRLGGPLPPCLPQR